MMWAAAMLLGALPSLNAGLPFLGETGKPRPEPSCGEHRAPNTTINPLAWQLKYVNETKTLRDVAARLSTLDAARRMIMESKNLRSQIPCRNERLSNPFCDSVKTAAARAAHAALARKVELPLDRPVVFYRHEMDCQPLHEDGCAAIFGGCPRPIRNWVWQGFPCVVRSVTSTPWLRGCPKTCSAIPA